MKSFLQFKPLYQTRVWGGEELTGWLGRASVPGGPIGESWEIVDREEAQSVVATGEHSGRSLRELIESAPERVMGPGWDKSRRFPILVKWLDCRERLSLQVHPPASIAKRLGGEPKTENWYIAKADGNAAVFAGLKAGVTADQFESAIAGGTLESCMRRLPVRAGDSLLIRSGVMHAIDAGNVILEIQQNSDTTYRVYDWGRVGLDGKPRAMHVRESMESLRASLELQTPELCNGSGADAVLAECAEFRIRRTKLAAGGRLTLQAGQEPRIVSLVEGGVRDESSGTALTVGDNALLPYSAGCDLRADQGAVLLVTEAFANERPKS